MLKASRRRPAARPPPALPLDGATAGNVSVVTVEASQALVPALVRLMGELGSVYDLWLTLAPLVRDEAALALAPVYTPQPEPVDQGRCCWR